MLLLSIVGTGRGSVWGWGCGQRRMDLGEAVWLCNCFRGLVAALGGGCSFKSLVVEVEAWSEVGMASSRFWDKGIDSRKRFT